MIWLFIGIFFIVIGCFFLIKNDKGDESKTITSLILTTLFGFLGIVSILIFGIRLLIKAANNNFWW